MNNLIFLFNLIGFIFCFLVYNFFYRIDYLFFGEFVLGIINFLDGIEKIVVDRKCLIIIVGIFNNVFFYIFVIDKRINF